MRGGSARHKARRKRRASNIKTDAQSSLAEAQRKLAENNGYEESSITVDGLELDEHIEREIERRLKGHDSAALGVGYPGLGYADRRLARTLPAPRRRAPREMGKARRRRGEGPRRAAQFWLRAEPDIRAETTTRFE
jgi:hypothetical protein